MTDETPGRMPPSSDEAAIATTFDPDDVASPCVSVCKMDPSAGSTQERGAGGLCVGCLRTLDEIVEWGGASDARKHAILAAARTRRI